MKFLLILLDGPTLGSLLGVGFLFIVLPIAALIFLIWLFRRRNRKDQ